MIVKHGREQVVKKQKWMKNKATTLIKSALQREGDLSNKTKYPVIIFNILGIFCMLQ